MPVPGGLLPAQSAQYAELAAITRRAFIPQLYVQIYNTSPLLGALLANAQSAGGGVSSVTVPVQGSPMTAAAWAGYDGTFPEPEPLTGVTDAEFNLALALTPIPFLGMEGLVQLDHAVIPLIQARMNDATNTTMDLIASAAYTNISTTNNAITGLDGAFDNGTNLTTYGNINRASNPWWSSYYKNIGSGTVAPTRANLLQYIAGLNNYSGEHPTFGVTDFGTWANLAQDYLGKETYYVTPGAAFDTEANRPRSMLKALDVAGVPIYADPYCPVNDVNSSVTGGTIYLCNSNYFNAYFHEQGMFNFSGFESTLSNFQVGYVGVVINALQLVCVKPKAQARLPGWAVLSI
jgi:hypothetical protein